MYTVHDLLKARLGVARREMGHVMAHLTDADVEWAPAPGVRTFGGQIMEVANKETEAVGWIKTGEWVEVEDFDPHASLPELKGRLEAIRADTLVYLDSLSAADLDREVENPDGWWEGLRLSRCPVHEVVRGIAAHEWYHTGQMITYLWMRGDDPDKW